MLLLLLLFVEFQSNKNNFIFQNNKQKIEKVEKQTPISSFLLKIFRFSLLSFHLSLSFNLSIFLCLILTIFLYLYIWRLRFFQSIFTYFSIIFFIFRFSFRFTSTKLSLRFGLEYKDIFVLTRVMLFSVKSLT